LIVAIEVAEIAGLLRELSQRTASRGGSPYRAKSYARAADNLLALGVPINQLIAEDRLQEIPGVGEAIASIIKRISATGTHPALESMRKEIPEGGTAAYAAARIRSGHPACARRLRSIWRCG
jgi:DNA polymerase (family 10)